MENINWKKLGLYVVLLFVAFNLYSASKGKILHVTYLNVGQGDGALIVTPSGKTIMIDGGETDQYQKALLPYFKEHKINRIDYMILSHPHSDHLGGLVGILKNKSIQVGHIYEDAPAKSLLYKTFKKLIAERNIPCSHLWRGDKMDFGDGLKAEVLHPPKGGFINHSSVSSAASDSPDGEDPNLNNQSIVLRFIYKNEKFLFTGDMEEAVDADLLKHKIDVQANVYKVAHHGSRTSSTLPLLKKIKPELCVISCGLNNKFGHPHKETLDKFKYLKLKYFRTDLDGQVDIWTDGTKLITACKSEPIKFVVRPRVIFNEDGFLTFYFKLSKYANVKIKTGTSKDKLTTALAAPYGIKEYYLTIKKAGGKKIYYQVEASYTNDASQKVSYTSYVTVKPLTYGKDVKIKGIQVFPEETYIFQPIGLKINCQVKKSGVYTFRVYQDGILGKNKVIEKKISLQEGQNDVKLSGWSPDITRKVNLYVMILKGTLKEDIKQVGLNVKEKLVLISASKKNKFTLKNEMEPMYVYMANKGGYRCVLTKSKITKTLLKKASILLITDPVGTYVSSEITAITSFVKNGGALILACEADYYNAGNPQALNEILSALGSKLRFNDDEVVDSTKNAGIPFIPVPDNFPSKFVYPGVKQIVMRSTTSLIDSNGKKLVGGDGIEIFAAAKGTASNLDADHNNDAVLYMTGEAIPLVAGEKIGEGKVAIYGSSAVFTYMVYNGSDKQQTPLFNLSVWDWLTGSITKLDGSFSEWMEGVATSSQKVVSKLKSSDSPELENTLYQKRRYNFVLKEKLLMALEKGDFMRVNAFLNNLENYSPSEQRTFYPLLVTLRSKILSLRFAEVYPVSKLQPMLDKISKFLK
jgi:competence protein ComEC